jgi:putative salt-induced outer membrane protein YdiY
MDLRPFVLVPFLFAGAAGAQKAPVGPVPGWDLKTGFSYLATSGNSETRSSGFETAFNRAWKKWSLEGTANAASASKRNRKTAESYNGQVRAKRRLGRMLKRALQLTAGLRGERNRFAGVDARTGVDVSLLWPVVENPVWKLRVLSGLSFTREDPRGDRSARDSFGGLFQVAGDGRLSETATWEGQVTFFPDFADFEDYRVNGRLGVQAALNRHLGVRVGYDWKYDHEPVVGFDTTDATTNVSLILQLGRRAAG